MGNCQLVLRYFALRDSDNIRGSMKTMLDRAMESRIGLGEDEVDELKDEYLTRLAAAAEIFAPRPFLLPPDEKGRERVSAALYDASLVAIHHQWREIEYLKRKGAGIRKRLKREFSGKSSSPILTGQGNTAQAVKDRISLMESILRDGAGL